VTVETQQATIILLIIKNNGGGKSKITNSMDQCIPVRLQCSTSLLIKPRHQPYFLAVVMDCSGRPIHSKMVKSCSSEYL
jgi:hypothetical protein